MPITHATQTAVPDDPAYDIGSNEWNEAHDVDSLQITGGTVTADAPVFDATQTWNNGAVAFNVFKIAITETASSGLSKFIDLSLNGTSRFYVSRNGDMHSLGRAYVDSVDLGSSSVVVEGATKSGRHTVTAGYNNSADAYFGGNGFTFYDPADGSTVRAHLTSAASGEFEVNNGTTGTYRDFKLRNLLAGGGNGSYVQTPSMTVANLASAATAGAGARAFVTDATATTFLSTVAGGGSNKVPVVSDGTNWLIG